MILSATLSKPTTAVEAALGANYIRVKIKLLTASTVATADTAAQADDTADAARDVPRYTVELYTQKQAFHKKFTEAECQTFLEAHAGHTFRACVERTESEEITILANKHGKITRLVKQLQEKPLSAPTAAFTARSAISASEAAAANASCSLQRDTIPHAGAPLNRRKNYILSEGVPVPFLVHLGVMTAEGKVLSAKYDKFRQINRFLEYVADVLPAVLAQRKAHGAPVSEEAPLRIVDFGSGKSYLTFAVHYFLRVVRALPCDITGLDLKEDVIAYCNTLSRTLGTHDSLHFAVGDIAQYGDDASPDIVITLHACDTATDYALDYAVRRGALAILSVPCCQHEVNAQIDESLRAHRAQAASATTASAVQTTDPTGGTDIEQARAAFAPLLRHGILKERFSALVTDALRAEYLEQAGYRVQVLEFIDMSHTPKNLLIRAVRSPARASTATAAGTAQENCIRGAQALEAALGITPAIQRLLG